MDLTQAVLNELGSDPEGLAAIIRRNSKEALLRHDLSHQRNEMFRIVGIDPSPRKAAREQRLKHLAGLFADVDQRPIVP